MDRVTAELGRALRRARLARGLILRDLDRQSRGAFKPSSVAGYERGERKITVERFCALAELYGVAPDRLLAEALAQLDPIGRTQIVVDLNRPSTEPGEEGRLLDELVREVRAARGDYGGTTITLRSGDLEVLARTCGREPRELLESLRGTVALRSP